MINRQRIARFLILIIVSYTTQITPVIIDNRYFPLYDRVFFRSLEYQSRAGFDIFFTTADQGLNQIHEKVGLPEIYGCFDQIIIGNALEAVGKTNPLRIDLQKENSIAWKTDGKINAQGFNFGFEKSLNNYLSFGFTMGFMYANSRIVFTLPPNTQDKLKLNEGGLLRLDAQRREMLTLLGLQAPQWSAAQLLDTELFLRIGKIWEYVFKTRRLDLNGQIGVIIPTGQQRDIYNPASIPFGGNGHWGISNAVSLAFELKEDLMMGITGLLNARFASTQDQRMSAAGEPYIYGSIVGQAKVTPGVTLGFTPYFVAEGLRDGLGAYIRYVYMHHMCDKWIDKRNNKTPPACLNTAVSTSAWTTEYFSFNIFYDFKKTEDNPSYIPRASVVVDIPVEALGARQSCRTARVSLGFETYF